MRLSDPTLFVVTTVFRFTNSTSQQHNVSVCRQREAQNKISLGIKPTNLTVFFSHHLNRRGRCFRITTSLLLKSTVFDARTLPFDGIITCLELGRMKNPNWAGRHTYSFGVLDAKTTS